MHKKLLKKKNRFRKGPKTLRTQNQVFSGEKIDKVQKVIRYEKEISGSQVVTFPRLKRKMRILEECRKVLLL